MNVHDLRKDNYLFHLLVTVALGQNAQIIVGKQLNILLTHFIEC